MKILLALAILFAFLTPSVAKAVPSLENSPQEFVKYCADSTMAFLANPGMDRNQKKKAFQKLLTQHFDLRTIARFALGRYWRTANDAQKEEYLTLFQNMIVDIYSSRFDNYSGQTITITGSLPDGEKDFIVSSIVQSAGNSDITVDWRVRKKEDRYAVVDVVVAGVSMAVTQRSDFSSVIQRGGGDVEVLLGKLRLSDGTKP